jgi:hypothetical protein
MPTPRQEDSIDHIALAVTAPLKEWFKGYAYRQGRTMSGEIRHMLVSLHQKDTTSPTNGLVG